MSKICPRCRILKPFESYHLERTRKDGVAYMCRVCANERAKAYRRRRVEKDPDFYRKNNLRNFYKMTMDDYVSKLAAQGGRCAICKCISSRTLHVDHQHGTRTIRGLLCDACNLGLGKFKDDPSVLRAAAHYLEQSNVRIP